MYIRMNVTMCTVYTYVVHVWCSASNGTVCFLDNRKPLRYESLNVRRIAHHTYVRFVGIYNMLYVKCVHTTIETCPHKKQYNSIGSAYERTVLI
jgi:hypothetical protein